MHKRKWMKLHMNYGKVINLLTNTWKFGYLAKVKVTKPKLNLGLRKLIAYLLNTPITIVHIDFLSISLIYKTYMKAISLNQVSTK